jgi:predicted metal-dependent hydrolase
MRPRPPPNYLAAYPAGLSEQVQQLILDGKMADKLLHKYPDAHEVRSDRTLYEYVIDLKEKFIKNSAALNRVTYDGSLQVMKNALGLHTSVSRVQGVKLKSRREIRVASVFRDMPPEFLRMIVVHELAHLKEQEHNKAFYQLCCHMEPEYHQFEFDLRVYLTCLEFTGQSLWTS